MMQPSSELMVEVLLANGINFLFVNMLWIGLAFYAWILFRRVRRQLAVMPLVERATQRGPLAKRAAIRFSRVLGLCMLLFLADGYWSEVRLHMSAHHCKQSKSEKDGGLYIGEKCSVDGDDGGVAHGSSGLLRLYDVQTGELLARETVPNPEGDLHWETNEVWQQGSDENGTHGAVIHLPPTAWDKFKAKLP